MGVVVPVPPPSAPSMHLESDPEEWPPKYTKLELDLSGGGKLAFVDSRRCGEAPGVHGATRLPGAVQLPLSHQRFTSFSR